jgi:two-component system response regulator HydG
MSIATKPITTQGRVLKPVILVVDDEELVRGFFTAALEKRGYTVLTAFDGEDGWAKIESMPVDLIISDIKMPRLDGMELLKRILGAHPTLPVILLTAYSSIENAVEAMRNGAFDYLPKPILEMAQVEFIISRALEHRRLLVENSTLKQTLSGEGALDQMIGPGRAMQHVFRIIKQTAPTQASVLITGATGTGKELAARALHNHSPRANNPFVQLNCAAVPETLIESELFGHKKGAYTGAFETTKGRFEVANGGTLLLDEIGDMPVQLQARLLRALQERQIERIGSTETISIDVRVIATTHRDLPKMIEEGKFREDLFYRLNVIRIKMPTLAERKEDIPNIAYHLLRKHAVRHGLPVTRFSPGAMSYLTNASWPGNVRQLENTIERAVTMCSGDTIDIPHFLLDLEDTGSGIAEVHLDASALPYQTESYLPLPLDEIEKRHILATLRQHNGQRLRTAEALQISIRTLRNKLNLYRSQGEKIDHDDDDDQ